MTHTAGVRLVFATLACVCVVGCSESQPRPRTPPRASDKAALYGDPALVPTRQGERARREVALAEELRLAVEVLGGVQQVRASVSEDPPSAVVVVRAAQLPGPDGARTESDRELLQSRVETVARHVLAHLDPEHISVQLSAPSAAPSPEEVPGTSKTPLLLAVLGLGFCLGLVFDRGRSVALSYAANRGLKASRTRGA